MSKRANASHKRLLTAVGAAAAALLALDAGRGAVAAWTLFAPDVPGATPAAPERVAEAASLAPQDGVYASWRATAAATGLRTAWLSPGGAAAETAARHRANQAVSALVANPYAHLTRAAVLLDSARRPGVDLSDASRLRQEALHSIEAGQAAWPRSPAVQDRAARVLLQHWAVLDEDGRTIVVSAAVGTASIPLTFRNLLRDIAEVAFRYDENATEAIRWLIAATPRRPRPLRELAIQLERRVGRDEGAGLRVARAALDSRREAGTVAPGQLRELRAWQTNWQRYFPNEATERSHAIDEAIGAEPDHIALWLLRVEVSLELSQDRAAVDALARAGRLIQEKAGILLTPEVAVVPALNELADLIAEATPLPGIDAREVAALDEQLQAYLALSQGLER